jgi:hypothetical protein
MLLVAGDQLARAHDALHLPIVKADFDRLQAEAKPTPTPKPPRRK